MRRRQRVHRRFAIRACDAEQPLTHARMLRTTVNDRHRELRMFGFGKSIRDPLADTKSAERWLASFPANDQLAVHVELLNELGRLAERVTKRTPAVLEAVFYVDAHTDNPVSYTHLTLPTI